MRYVLSRNISIRSKGKEFVDYFRKTYLNAGCRYPKSMWSHWDNHGDRTNNRVEGDNNRMKLFCGAADPKIDKAIGLLQQYETTVKHKYMNSKKSTAKAPPQRGDDAIRDANFRQARRFHRDGMISFADYYKQILDIFKFEPKKKYVEELADTGESDVTSISDISDEDQDVEDEYEDTTVNEASNEDRTGPYNLQAINNVLPSTSSTVISETQVSAHSSSTSIASTVSNNPNADQNEVICDLCSKIYKKRGLKKHRNDCLKKPQNWSINRDIN